MATQTTSNGVEVGLYVWVQGNIRGGACFVYGASGSIRDFLRLHFITTSDTPDGMHLEAPGTIVVNTLKVCNYHIYNTISIEALNLLWTLAPNK